MVTNRCTEYWDDIDQYDDLKQWSEDFDADQQQSDIWLWSGLSMCVGLILGLIIGANW